MINLDLPAFVRESNRIEGILRDPTDAEIEAHRKFILTNDLLPKHFEDLVATLQPGAILRDSKSVPGVRVGNHIAPASGPEIREELLSLIKSAYTYFDGRMAGFVVPSDWEWRIHCAYETLHPFTDGNGRSGRAFWLWCMGGIAPLGFLHQFYYQTLSAYR